LYIAESENLQFGCKSTCAKNLWFYSDKK
jgi:hypothetical protein